MRYQSDNLPKVDADFLEIFGDRKPRFWFGDRLRRTDLEEDIVYTVQGVINRVDRGEIWYAVKSSNIDSIYEVEECYFLAITSRSLIEKHFLGCRTWEEILHSKQEREYATTS